MAKNKAAWTVMVYLAGDNNLTTECMFALTEMKDAGLCEEVNVIAQFDPSDPYLPSHRYEINKKRESLYSDIIDRARYYKGKGEVNFKKESRKAASLAALRRSVRKSGQEFEKASLTGSKANKVITNDTDTGSPITLYNFISFCLEEYPAEHYLVVLSGHAGGTERDYLLKDESSAGSLTFNELKQVFRRVKKDRGGKLIDIVGMDNCLMSMAEICYEIRGLAEVVVGCESFSPTSGWPYRQILERLCKDFVNPGLTRKQSVTEEAAKVIVEEYVNYYSTYWMAGLSVTQSALNLKKVEGLQLEIDKLALRMEKELLSEWENNAAPKRRRFESSLLLAHWEAQSYNGEQFVDVYDFCDCLENRVESKAVARQCQEVKKFVASEFVLKSCYSGAAYQYSYGVSMYFPWAQISPSYFNLDFINDAKGKGWGSFLKTYTRLTRRVPRGLAKEVTDDSSANGQMASAGTTDHRMISDRMISDRMISDRMISDRMISDRMISDRMISDRMDSAKARIHSMRNPPDVFLPDQCIRDRDIAMKSQKVLRAG